jgi:hypothetical protein
MAQIVKLKRTSVQGKVPTISNVELGELAMNTYDGRIFFEKSSSLESIQEILTTNTGRAITGSINLNGSITASYFKGDGSQLTNVSTDIGEVATVTSSFDNSSTIDVGHNFSTKNVIVSVYDSNDNQIIPQTVTLTDTDNVRVVLSAAQSGFVVVAKGGHVVSGSADDSNKLNGQLASYYLDYSNFTNVPSGLLSSSAFSSPSQGTVRATINGTQTDVDTGLQTGDSPTFNNLILDGNLTVNGTTTTVNSNTVNIGDNMIVLNSDESGTPSQDAGIEIERGTSTNVKFQFKESTDRWQFSNDGSTFFNLPTSTADVAEFSNLYYTDTRVLNYINSRGVVSGSSQVNADSVTNFDSNVLSYINDLGVVSGSITSQLPTGVVSGSSQVSYTGLSNIPSGIVSGSSQITDLTTHKETVSGASSYAVDHNLNEQYPIVQAWNTGTSQQELPTSITTNSVNRVTVVFSTTFAGVIIVKK